MIAALMSNPLVIREPTSRVDGSTSEKSAVRRSGPTPAIATAG
jgi:hypothetical protein